MGIDDAQVAVDLGASMALFASVTILLLKNRVAWRTGK
jgi:hypothetical protein